jgi:hypothetical protein
MTFAKDRAEWLERREAEKAANLSALCQPSRTLRKPTYSGGVSGEAVQKEEASQHAGYMAAVRDLGYCMRCRRSCRPQFCHRDCGKGMGIKTDVREGWPGCPECHYIVGTSGFYSKEERRALELELGQRTREAVKAAGTWPKTLPQWETA